MEKNKYVRKVEHCVFAIDLQVHSRVLCVWFSLIQTPWWFLWPVKSTYQKFREEKQHSVLLRINIDALRAHAEHCGTHTHTPASPGWFFKAALQIGRKRGDLFASFSVQDPCSDAYHDEWYSHQRTRWVIVMATRLIMEMINEALSYYTVFILYCCIHHILKQTFTQFKYRKNYYMLKCTVHITVLQCWVGGGCQGVARVLGWFPCSCYGDGDGYGIAICLLVFQGFLQDQCAFTRVLWVVVWALLSACYGVWWYF